MYPCIFNCLLCPECCWIKGMESSTVSCRYIIIPSDATGMSNISIRIQFQLYSFPKWFHSYIHCVCSWNMFMPHPEISILGRQKKVHHKKPHLSCSLQVLFEEVGEGQWEVIRSLTVPPGQNICLSQGMGLWDCGSWPGKEAWLSGKAGHLEGQAGNSGRRRGCSPRRNFFFT